jgi:hypothetical protein
VVEACGVAGVEFRLFGGLRRLVAGDCLLELPHAASQRSTHLRKALAPEEKEQHDEDDDYLRPSEGDP